MHFSRFIPLQLCFVLYQQCCQWLFYPVWLLLTVVVLSGVTFGVRCCFTRCDICYPWLFYPVWLLLPWLFYLVWRLLSVVLPGVTAVPRGCFIRCYCCYPWLFYSVWLLLSVIVLPLRCRRRHVDVYMHLYAVTVRDARTVNMLKYHFQRSMLFR